MATVDNQQVIKGNDPLVLNDPQVVWIVKSGSLVLHSTLIDNNHQPQGNRRYLFNISAGEALLGISLQWGEQKEETRAILAVALEETCLEKLSLDEFLQRVAHKDQEAIALLEGWIVHLGDWLTENRLDHDPFVNPLIAEGNLYLSLLKGQALIAPVGSKQGVSWVSISQGSTAWMGKEELSFDESSPPMPLTGNMWLEAQTLVDLSTASTVELEQVDSFALSLEKLHHYFFEYFNLVEVKKISDDFNRFQQRERLNRQMIEGSMGELAQVLDPSPDVALWEQENHLLMAVGAIGRAIGIEILPPGKSEDLERVRDPLEAIARASQCRTRRVLLVGEWWTQEHGALLGYMGEEKRPVALLPDDKGNYVIFDPQIRQKIPLNQEALDQISGEAFMFYRPLPSFMSNVFEVFAFGVKGYEKDIVIIIILGLLGTLLGMVTPQATAILINSAIPDSDRVLLFQLGLALFAAAIGQGAFQLGQSIVSLRVENATDATLQPAVWDRLLKLSPAFFRKYSSGDLVKRILAVGQIRAQLSGATQRSLLSGVFALLNLVLMFAYSIQLAWVGLILSLIVATVTIISSRLLVTKQRQQEELDGDINSLTVELINGVSKLRVAAAEERGFAAWGKRYGQRMKLQSSIKAINDSITVFNEILPLISSILLFWYAILFIQMSMAQNNPSGLSAGTFLAFNAAFSIYINGVTDLSNVVTDILDIVPLWERAEPILQTELESDPSKADPGVLTGSIVLDHITFRYREDGPLILDDVTIEAKPGEFVAFVGPSGSGKSTLFRLLLGFEIPISGTVYYDGQDLAGLNIQAVRRQLGVVLQNVRITAAPIYESIAAGALVTLDEAWEAARKSGFAEDIEQMPMKMHTIVSEGGTNLSGGQRQRLLIARALVSNPKIIIMDEATSALDNRTQAIVTESLDRMNATRIVVAHRLSTIRNADRIYVIEAGRVVQVGNFDELVQQEGLFARLVARQLD